MAQAHPTLWAQAYPALPLPSAPRTVYTYRFHRVDIAAKSGAAIVSARTRTSGGSAAFSWGTGGGSEP